MKTDTFEHYSKTFIQTFPDLTDEQKFKLISLLLESSPLASSNEFIIVAKRLLYLISPMSKIKLSRALKEEII